jgi:DNA polymerase-3 subunit gamma/tau
MGYEPLHHKYRPQTFTELVGQDAIAQTLSHALEQQRIAPAYLFCGPRGTGKTSSARILAKSLNCLSHKVPHPHPCGQCEVCRGINNGSILDIVEIDAASNTGVDNIRELIERSQFAPVQCRYKVYVIDECHMLSTAAFNALLKTLEEPPAQVVFVLATTDPQRVLPTIISRCQRFDFRRIPLEPMVHHLQAIATQEQIEITEDAIRLVAQIAQGGLRDAQSLLDQLSLLTPPVTAEKVWDLVGAVPERDLLALTQAIAADDSVATLEIARRLMDRGREPLIVLQNLASFYRDLIIAKTASERADLVAVTPPTWEAMQTFTQAIALPWLLTGQQTLRQAEIQIRNTTQPRLWLEVTLLELLPATRANDGLPTPSMVVTPVLPNLAPPTIHTDSLQVTPPTPPVPLAPPQPSPCLKPQPIPPATTPSTSSVPSLPLTSPSALSPTDLIPLWTQIIGHIQPMGTRALIQQQGHLIVYDGQSARIGIKSKPLFKMAQGKLSNIEAAFQAVINQPVKVTLEVAEAPSESTSTASASDIASPSAPDQLPKNPAIAPSVQDEIAPPTVSEPQSTPPSPKPELTPPSDFELKVKSFAEFFNGQIVNWEDDYAELLESESKPPPPPPDVPF